MPIHKIRRLQAVNSIIRIKRAIAQVTRLIMDSIDDGAGRETQRSLLYKVQIGSAAALQMKKAKTIFPAL